MPDRTDDVGPRGQPSRARRSVLRRPRRRDLPRRLHHHARCPRSRATVWRPDLEERRFVSLRPFCCVSRNGSKENDVLLSAHTLSTLAILAFFIAAIRVATPARKAIGATRSLSHDECNAGLVCAIPTNCDTQPPTAPTRMARPTAAPRTGPPRIRTATEAATRASLRPLSRARRLVHRWRDSRPAPGRRSRLKVEQSP